MENDEANPYQSPEERGFTVVRPLQPISTTSLTIAILLAVMAGTLLTLQPRFAKMFEDFELQLPALSKLAFNPVLAYATGLVALAALLNAIFFPSEKDKVLNAVYFVFALLVAAIFFFGAVMPLFSLIEALS